MHREGRTCHIFRVSIKLSIFIDLSLNFLYPKAKRQYDIIALFLYGYMVTRRKNHNFETYIGALKNGRITPRG